VGKIHVTVTIGKVTVDGHVVESNQSLHVALQISPEFYRTIPLGSNSYAGVQGGIVFVF
jgi:hypothetical protein